MLLWYALAFLPIFFIVKHLLYINTNTKPKDYTGAYALVTGGSYGIGFQIAKLLAKDGYNIVLVARDKSKLQNAQSALQKLNSSIQVVTIAKDLSVPGCARELYAECLKNVPRIDFLINNAGFGLKDKLGISNEKSLMEMVELNITTLTHLTRLILPDMLKRKKGKILNVGSLAGAGPGPAMASYYASKAYVNTFSQALSYELKGTGVSCTVVIPSATATEFGEKAGNENSVLFQLVPVLSSEQTAYEGYVSMMRGDILRVPGWINWTLWLSSGIVPHQLYMIISDLLLYPVKKTN